MRDHINRNASQPHGFTSGGVGKVLVYGLTALTMLILVWMTVQSFTLAVTFLLTALLSPVAGWLRRHRIPASAAAPICLMTLLGLLAVLGLLIWTRTGQHLNDLTPALTQGIDAVRSWLTSGPFSMDESTVVWLRDQLVTLVDHSLPSPLAGTRTALNILSALALALIAVFFLKDGP